MSNLKNSIAIKINQDKLLANLEFSFSNKSTVLGELMQNARRAGATRVTFNYTNGGTLLISDDGKGIEDFQNLFSVADSGWDAQTVQNERPFGMGFLSCLYGSEEVLIESNGKSINGKTSEILAGAALTVQDVGDTAPKRSYTTIVLTGFSLDADAIENSLKNLASGFAIPVFLNGKELSRKNALSTSKDGEFIYVPGIGDIKARHINLENSGHINLMADMKCYVQGLPVYSSMVWDGPEANVIHLDSTKYFARMPDRDKLIDESEAMKKITAAIHQIHLDRLLAMKANMTANEFATQNIANYAMYIEGGFKVLCGQDVRLSNRFFGEVNIDQPSCYYEAEKTVYERQNFSVSYEDVQAGNIVLFTTEDMVDYEESNAAAWIFARNMGWQLVERYNHVLGGDFKNNHWSKPFIHNLNNFTLKVEIVGQGKEGQISLDYWQDYCNVVLCESYRITYSAPGGKVYVCVIDDKPLLTEDGKLLVPDKATNPGSAAVVQGSSYINNDDFDERSCDDDARALNHYVEMLRSGDETKSLQSLLNTVSLSEYKDFIGQKYELQLDEYCNVVLTKLAA